MAEQILSGVQTKQAQYQLSDEARNAILDKSPLAAQLRKIELQRQRFIKRYGSALGSTPPSR